MSPSSVLVTGASGYVGRLTLSALARRADELGRIVALDVAPVDEADRRERVEYVTGDINEIDLGDLIRSRSVDTVIHLASIVRVPPGSPDDLAYRVDVLGTKRVLDASVESGVRTLIVTSSGAAYGYHKDSPEQLDEDDPVRGNSNFPYAWHKRLVEEMLATARREHPELTQLVLRAGTIIGEGTDSPVTDAFTGPVVLGLWGCQSPFVFIWDLDLVNVILSGVFDGAVGVFNVAGDGVMTTREIATRLHKRYLSIPSSLLYGVLWLLHIVGRSERGGEQVDFLRYRPVLSNRRLKEELGYHPIDSAAAFELWAQSRERYL